ncbi:unnamed protein product [Amoebophrya sp. A120]|nr:unnamed protein product [Amoebophrya sp. A120]|eukprot:GSA120T00006919001.1
MLAPRRSCWLTLLVPAGVILPAFSATAGAAVGTNHTNPTTTTTTTNSTNMTNYTEGAAVSVVKPEADAPKPPPGPPAPGFYQTARNRLNTPWLYAEWPTPSLASPRSRYPEPVPTARCVNITEVRQTHTSGSVLYMGRLAPPVGHGGWIVLAKQGWWQVGSREYLLRLSACRPAVVAPASVQGEEGEAVDDLAAASTSILSSCPNVTDPDVAFSGAAAVDEFSGKNGTKNNFTTSRTTAEDNNASAMDLLSLNGVNASVHLLGRKRNCTMMIPAKPKQKQEIDHDTGSARAQHVVTNSSEQEKLVHQNNSTTDAEQTKQTQTRNTTASQ